MINKTVTCFQSGLSVSKISDIATITNFSIPPTSSTRNPGIIPSNDPGEALSYTCQLYQLVSFRVGVLRDPPTEIVEILGMSHMCYC